MALLGTQGALAAPTLKFGGLFPGVPGDFFAWLTIMKFPVLAFPLLLNLAQYVII
jgi:hypothetical protein